jgi:hypothetical protein
VRASTLIDIATANGVRMPRPAEMLYQWQDFYGFLELLRLGTSAVRRTEDFARVAYECIEDLHRHGNVRHAEIFFNPHYYTPNGATYPEIVDGLIDGLERAEGSFGVSSLLISCIGRSAARLPLLPPAHEPVPYNLEGAFPALRFSLFTLQSHHHKRAEAAASRSSASAGRSPAAPLTRP